MRGPSPRNAGQIFCELGRDEDEGEEAEGDVGHAGQHLEDRLEDSRGAGSRTR